MANASTGPTLAHKENMNLYLLLLPKIANVPQISALARVVHLPLAQIVQVMDLQNVPLVMVIDS